MYRLPDDAWPEPWPPAEPVVPTTVVARLDRLGWSVGTYELIDHTANHALIEYKTKFEPYVLIMLTDGHIVASYHDLGSGRDILRRLREREQEDEDTADDE